jgi:tetratricopeptide (TPR) repeat protein
MHRRRLLVLFAINFLLISVPGCSRDPEVMKQKHFERGDRYFEQGKYREAAIEFLNATKIDPQFTKAHRQLAETYIRLQTWPEAYRELQRTAELDSDDEQVRIKLGNLLIAARSFAEARGVAEDLLKKNPNSPEAHVLLAELNAAEGNAKAALIEQERAVSLDPNRADLLVGLAGLQSPTDVVLAESTLKKALAIDSKSIAAIEALALIYENTGRQEQAETLLRQGIELDPKNLRARQNLAQLYLSENRKTDAEGVMLQAKQDLGGVGSNYRVLGDYYENTGELDKATTEFASLCKQHPTDLALREDYIDLLLRRNKIEEGSRLVDEILKVTPKDNIAQLLRGRILNLKGQFKEATDILQAALKDSPEHAGGHYQLALALGNTGNLGRAEQELREAVRLEPRLTDAQLALAQIALSKGDRDTLREAAQQIIRSLPSDSRGYFLRAEAESRSNQTAAADADFKKAIEVDPQNPLAYSALGGWLLKNGKLQDAQKQYERALDRDPNQLAALNGLVAVFLKQNQNSKAEERVRLQIAKAQANDDFYTLLAGLQLTNKDLSGADASLQQALRLNGNNLSAVLLLSNVQKAEGSIDKALATAYQSIAQNPKSAARYFLAASLEDSRSNWQKAKELYEQALQIEPNYAPAANNLAYGLLEHQENGDMALSLAQIARQKMPDSASAADTLAWAYYQKGLYGVAADLLTEAIGKSPDNATYHYHIGMVYQKQRNTPAARKHLQRALEIDRHFPDADKIRAALNQMNS